MGGSPKDLVGSENALHPESWTRIVTGSSWRRENEEKGRFQKRLRERERERERKRKRESERRERDLRCHRPSKHKSSPKGLAVSNFFY
jgi:hypothetical protein